MTSMTADDLVVVDETSTNIHFTPRMARAPRGQRAYGVVPRNTPANITLIASMSLQGIGPSFVFDGATDTHAFVTYIEQVLAPSLRPGQVVLLDNLSVHKHARVQAAVAARGCRVWFLPPYSPDLNAIEPLWNQIKHTIMLNDNP